MRRRGAIPAIAIALSLLTAAEAGAAIDKQPLVANPFAAPVQVAQPPGDSRRLFVVVQTGRIRLIKDGALVATPFLDISDRVRFDPPLGNERGLLSVAFPPNYGDGSGSTTRRFYVFLTNNDGDIRIKELKRKRSTGDQASESYSRTLIKIPHPAPNHFGGQLQFGPEGFLYASTGDGGSGNDPPNNAQNKDVLLGKLLRIDPHASGSKAYVNPPDNPFAGATPGRGEIYSLGLRNPWRFSFEGERLSLADVGESMWEELNLVDAEDANGANFGWSGYEGPDVFDAARVPTQHRAPDFYYSHEGGYCSISGGAISHDPAIPQLEGRYVYGDYCRGALRSLDPDDPVATDAPLGVTFGPYSVTSVGSDNAGFIYITSFGDGRVYRLINAP